MSYRIVGNSSLIVQKDGELEDYIIDPSLSLNSIKVYIEAYIADKISRTTFVHKINPLIGQELYQQEYEEKLKFYENQTKVRKSKRLHDSLDIIEIDPNGNCYLTGYNWVIPQSIVDRLLDAKFNPNSRYTVDSLLMFLKQLMLCPNKNVRDNAINYIERNGMFITENGMLLTFRRVNKKENSDRDDQIRNIFKKVKLWKKGPSNYTLFEGEDGTIYYKFKSDDVLFETFEGEEARNIGNLQQLYDGLAESEEGDNKYWPQHKDNTEFYIDGELKTGCPYYIIGSETRLPREYCDESDNTCSRGLHTWSKNDHWSYTGFGGTILAVLISPIDFVSCPYSDNSKMRSAAIYPVAELTVNDLNEFDESCIGEIEDDYFNRTMSFICDEFNKNGVESIIKFNEEVTQEDIMNTIEDIADIVIKRNVEFEFEDDGEL